MNSFFLQTDSLIIDWLPFFYTHTKPERQNPQSDKILKQGDLTKVIYQFA